jgi:hypothetical protein
MHHQGYDITHILGILGQKSSQPSWHFLGWQNRPNQLGVCKKPEPFQMVFPGVIFFFLLSFSQALASHLDQRIHMSEEREKEKE